MEDFIPYFTKSIEGTELLVRIEDLASKLNYDPPLITLQGKKIVKNIALERINLAVEIVCSRHRAAYLGDWVRGGIILAEPLMQCSHPKISSYRARSFAGCSSVAEICTGLGIDTCALSREVARVFTFELNPMYAEMARYNFAIQGISNVTVITADPIKDPLMGEVDGVWSDPSRKRADGTKVRDPKDGSPSLKDLLALDAKLLGVKLSPGWQPNGEFEKLCFEWISLNAECKELILWSPSKNFFRAASILEKNFHMNASQIISIKSTDKISIEKHRFLAIPDPSLLASKLIFNIFSDHHVTCFNNQGLWGALTERLHCEGVRHYKIHHICKGSNKEILTFMDLHLGSNPVTVLKLGDSKNFNKIDGLVCARKTDLPYKLFCLQHEQKELVIIATDV